MAGQFSVQLVQHGAHLGLGMGLDLRGGCNLTVVHQALAVKVVNQRGLQRVGQPHQPLVEVGAVVCAHSGGQAAVRVRVHQVQANGRGFVQHQVGARAAFCSRLHQHRDQPVRVERQVAGRLVRALGAVDTLQFVRHAQLFEQHVRGEAGVAGEVVQLQHGARALRPK